MFGGRGVRNSTAVYDGDDNDLVSGGGCDNDIRNQQTNDSQQQHLLHNQHKTAYRESQRNQQSNIQQYSHNLQQNNNNNTHQQHNNSNNHQHSQQTIPNNQQQQDMKIRILLRKELSGFGFRTCGNKPVYVQSVTEGSPADKQGLRCKDMLFMINSVNVANESNSHILNIMRASNVLDMTVLRMADKDDSEFVTNQIEGLLKSPALLASFINVLIQTNKQNPLLLSLVLHSLSNTSTHQVNFQRWSYEIVSTFLTPQSPLKINTPHDTPSLQETMSISEDDIRGHLTTIDLSLQATIRKSYCDFLKRIGPLEEYDCKNAEQARQMKMVDKTLWKAYSILQAEERDDKKQALACCLSTFMYQTGFLSYKGGWGLFMEGSLREDVSYIKEGYVLY